MGTDLKYAITDGIRAAFQANPEEFEPRNVFGAARSRAEEVVKEKLRLFKAVDRI